MVKHNLSKTKESQQFVYECPECLAKDKIIKRCVSCKIPCCSNCSIQGVCMECYIILKNEVNTYFNLKILESIET